MIVRELRSDWVQHDGIKLGTDEWHIDSQEGVTLFVFSHEFWPFSVETGEPSTTESTYSLCFQNLREDEILEIRVIRRDSEYAASRLLITEDDATPLLFESEG